MRFKGYVLSQVILESVIICAVVILLLFVTTRFLTAGHREDVKLRSLELNVHAFEQLRSAYRETGDESVFDYSEEDGDYTTMVKSADSVQEGGAVMYRVVVATAYRSDPIEGTEVTAYVAGQ